MDQTKFRMGFKTASTKLDENKIYEIIKEDMENRLSNGFPYGHINFIIAMEESGELLEALNNYLHNSFLNYSENKLNLLEETADMKLNFYYINHIFEVNNKPKIPIMNNQSKKVSKVYHIDDIQKEYISSVCSFTQNVSRYIRGRENTLIADIKTLDYLIHDSLYSFGFTNEELNQAINIKIDRIAERTERSKEESEIEL